MNIIDIKETLAEHPEGSFINLLAFNQRHFGACNITGESPVWEMHPDTDEFFYILEGQFEITLLDSDSPSKHSVSANSCFVVPKGIWHKPAAPNGCKFIYYTPGQSCHSDAADPRKLNR